MYDREFVGKALLDLCIPFEVSASDSCAREFLQLFRICRARRNRKLGEHPRAEVEVYCGALHEGFGVRERFRKIAIALFCRFDRDERAVVPVRSCLRIRDLPDDIADVLVFGFQVVRTVRGRERQSECFRDAGRAYLPLAAAVPAEPRIDIFFPERFFQELYELVSAISNEDRIGEKCDEAFPVRFYVLCRHFRSARASEVCLRDEFQKVVIAFIVFCDEDDVSFEPSDCDIRVSPEYRFDLFFVACFVKFDRAVEIVLVRERESRHAVVRRGFDQGLYLRNPIEEREVAMRREVREAGHGRSLQSTASGFQFLTFHILTSGNLALVL